MFDTVEDALLDLKAGKLIIVTDDEDRENEGDLVGITEFIDSDAVNFMAIHGRGLICTPVSREIAETLNLTPMAEDNTDDFKTAFTVSVDHVDTTTGISAHERFMTMKALMNGTSKDSDFNRPGHVFPLIAKSGGVLERGGHTEAAVTLAKLSGAAECAVICEIMNDDGTMARIDDLEKYKQRHGLKMITIRDLTHYVEHTLSQGSKVNLPTEHGTFTMYDFITHDGISHLALVHGDITPGMNVRIHSECLTGDVFGSRRCDCGEQLDRAMEIISEEDGIILYMRQEGRGIGLTNKLKAYELIEQGFDTVTANEHLGFDADLRTYDAAAFMLKQLGALQVTLMSNNPRKAAGLRKEGIKVHQRPHMIQSNRFNRDYLNTKKEKLGHLLQEDMI